MRKNILTIILCLSLGTLTALLGSFVPEAFARFMEIANTGANWGASGWAAFIYIGFLATLLFFAGHGFKVLNKHVARIVEKYFSFLDD